MYKILKIYWKIPKMKIDALFFLKDFFGGSFIFYILIIK